jgi:hypothetical protein
MKVKFADHIQKEEFYGFHQFELILNYSAFSFLLNSMVDMTLYNIYILCRQDDVKSITFASHIE